MAIYKTRFERFNFQFEPPLQQVSDVIFKTNIPYDGEHLREFIEASWEAMWKQNPHWRDPSPPIFGMMGWSSVLASRSYEKLK
jgi:hypothetical protein